MSATTKPSPVCHLCGGTEPDPGRKPWEPVHRECLGQAIDQDREKLRQEAESRPVVKLGSNWVRGLGITVHEDDLPGHRRFKDAHRP